MPTLRRKPNGKWYINYTDAQGIRRRESIRIDGQPVRDEATAREYFRHWQQAQPDHTPTEAGKSPTIQRVMDYYRDIHLHHTNAAPATHRAVQTHCAAFLEFCRGEHIGRCQQLSMEVIARWSVELQRKKKARTAKNYITTIRSALNFAVQYGLLEKSPIDRWTFPRVDPVEKDPLSIKEVGEILEIFRDVPIIQWIALTGNRPSDARTLTFRQVDVAARKVDRGSEKPRDIRKYQICDRAALLVAREAERIHDRDDIVFLSSIGKPWTADGLLNSMLDKLSRAEYHRRVTPKMLRDSFATIMANEVKIPLPALQVLMGHTSITTTMKYVRPEGCEGYLSLWNQQFVAPHGTPGARTRVK